MESSARPDQARGAVMSTQANEMWVPRCPACGGNLVLAPANGFTKFLMDKVEVYCTHCSWRQVLANVIEKIYVRM